MKKKILVVLLMGLLLVPITGCGEKKVEIVKEAIQTSEYYGTKHRYEKYKITTKDELRYFKSLYSDVLAKYAEKLDGKNTIFVWTKVENSGSIKVEFRDVNFNDKKVNFVIKEKRNGRGTTDMALWYLVAVIPNSELKGLNLSDWINPESLIDF